jgi:hypothetical protein
MRAPLSLALALTASALAASAQAGEADLFPGSTALAAEDLDHRRGGTELLFHGTAQIAETSQNAENSGNTITLGAGAALNTGDIYSPHVTGNNGVTSVMLNTGNLVNMNTATSINVYTR